LFIRYVTLVDQTAVRTEEGDIYNLGFNVIKTDDETKDNGLNRVIGTYMNFRYVNEKQQV